MASLEKFDDDYTSSRPLGGGPLPDGVYSVSVVKMEIKPTRAGTHDALVWTFKVAEGAHTGRKVVKYSVIKEGKPIAYLKGDLTRAGMTLERFSDLEEEKERLVGAVLGVRLVTDNQGYSQVYIRGRLGAPPQTGGEDVPY